jgi:hypothetical protein
MHQAVILALDLEIDISVIFILNITQAWSLFVELSWLLSCRSKRGTRLLSLACGAACAALAPRHQNEDVKHLSGGPSLKVSGGHSLTQDSRLSESPPVAGRFSAEQKSLHLVRLETDQCLLEEVVYIARY